MGGGVVPLTNFGEEESPFEEVDSLGPPYREEFSWGREIDRMGARCAVTSW